MTPPPINIDGTTENYSTVTIDGQDVEQITIDGQDVLSAIPDSVVDRPNDNQSQSLTGQYGLRITSAVEWGRIGARISANVSGQTTAYLYRVSDGTLLVSKDISGLSAGDAFTIDPEPNLQPYDGTASTEYNFVLDAGGNSWTAGRLSNNDTSYPYTSSDGDLEIINGANGTSSTAAAAYSLVEIGDIGF